MRRGGCYLSDRSGSKEVVLKNSQLPDGRQSGNFRKRGEAKEVALGLSDGRLAIRPRAVNFTRTPAEQFRDSIPAATAVPTCLLRSK
jgi:hypothetical protein